MNPVFRTREFWQPYFELEPQNVSEAELAAQLDRLADDFPVREDKVTFEHAGQECVAVHRVVEFEFACGDPYTLRIEYQPDAYGCYKTLFLDDERSGDRSQMGWWDLARWHPYCFLPDELDMLLTFWQRQDRRWPSPELPLLLLGQFVGLDSTTDLESLNARADTACRALGLRASERGRQGVPLHVPAGYRWENDAELGWVFTSDDYCCYSLRNRPHVGSGEGQFPFAAFRKMMAGVRRRLADG